MRRERSRCRAVIENNRLVPGVEYDTAFGLCTRVLRSGEKWRAPYCAACVGLTGDHRPIFLTPGMIRQMKLMLAEGCFEKQMEAAAASSHAEDRLIKALQKAEPSLWAGGDSRPLEMELRSVHAAQERRSSRA